MKAIVPLDPGALGGESVTFDHDAFKVLADRGKVVIIEFHSLEPPVTWFGDFELLYCQRQHDPDMIKVVRKSTEEERKIYRIPLWIQDEETPECCGKPMFFVGQIDDDILCTEAPPDAEMWWHDAASFYVFTCPYCLGTKAVGQQF
jgi:hypothetical protein